MKIIIFVKIERYFSTLPDPEEGLAKQMNGIWRAD